MLKKVSLVVLTPDGTQIVPAYLVAPGLVVHHWLPRWGERTKKNWTVSHLHSGYSVSEMQLKTRRAAVEMALKLTALADWDKPLVSDKDLGVTPEVYKKIKAIMEGRTP